MHDIYPIAVPERGQEAGDDKVAAITLSDDGIAVTEPLPYHKAQEEEVNQTPNCESKGSGSEISGVFSIAVRAVWTNDVVKRRREKEEEGKRVANPEQSWVRHLVSECVSQVKVTFFDKDDERAKGEAPRVFIVLQV